MKSWLAGLLALLYVVGVLVLAGLGIAAWRLHCEGFGCVGVGIAWFAWACAFAVWLLVGALAKRLGAGSAVPSRIVRYGRVAQFVVGIVPLGYWVLRQLA